MIFEILFVDFVLKQKKNSNLVGNVVGEDINWTVFFFLKICPQIPVIFPLP